MIMRRVVEIAIKPTRVQWAIRSRARILVQDAIAGDARDFAVSRLELQRNMYKATALDVEAEVVERAGKAEAEARTAISTSDAAKADYNAMEKERDALRAQLEQTEMMLEETKAHSATLTKLDAIAQELIGVDDKIKKQWETQITALRAQLEQTEVERNAEHLRGDELEADCIVMCAELLAVDEFLSGYHKGDVPRAEKMAHICKLEQDHVENSMRLAQESVALEDQLAAGRAELARKDEALQTLQKLVYEPFRAPKKPHGPFRGHCGWCLSAPATEEEPQHKSDCIVPVIDAALAFVASAQSNRRACTCPWLSCPGGSGCPYRRELRAQLEHFGGMVTGPDHTPTSKSLVEVVSAVVVRDGRILLTQRPANKDFPLSWECPGGKVDGNESHHDTIRRELVEEIGTIVDQIAQQPMWCKEFYSIVVRGERKSIFLLMYAVSLAPEPRPLPKEEQGIGWFTAAEMAALELTPGNKAALSTIVEHMSRKAP